MISRKQWRYVLLTAVFLLSGCAPIPEAAFSPAPDAPAESPGAVSPAPEEQAGPILLTAGGETFVAELADNPAAAAFRTLLPRSFDMVELNGNEKYFRFADHTFPVEPTVPDETQAGDLCIYQNNCLVLFYETFSTTYAYTRIGRVRDPAGLADALGTGDVTVEMRPGSKQTDSAAGVPD